MDPLWLTILAVAALVALIAIGKVNAFIALTLVTFGVGLAAGMAPSAVATAYQTGVGDTLGSVAVVLTLGAILGRMLAESGGAEVVSRRLVSWLGESRLPWVVFLAGYVIGIPVFFPVGLVLLMPILYELAGRNKAPLLKMGLPLVATLSAMHGLTPPHPGPIAAVGILQADVGRVLLYSLVVCVPVAIIGGPWLGVWMAGRVTATPPAHAIGAQTSSRRKSEPSFVGTLIIILLPVTLMLCGTVAELQLIDDATIVEAARFLAKPVVSLLLAVLLAYWVFGWRRGFDRHAILRFSDECLTPLAVPLLIVGAGGGFSAVLKNSGVGQAVADAALSLPLSPYIVGWLVAAGVRVATGSATVAIITAASLLPINDPAVNKELFIVALGAGSLVLSHLNDGGFWLVKEYLNMTVPQTLRTWTIQETVMSVVALATVLLLAQVV